MFTYYDLKSDNKLPPVGVFVDPMDGHEFSIKPSDSIDNLIKRVEERRELTKSPKIFPDELRTLMVEFMWQKSNDNQRKQFFEKKMSLPTVGQIFGYARTIAEYWAHGRPIPIKQRIQRTNDCLDCDKHSGRAKAWVIVTALNKVVFGLKEMQSPPDEDKLGRCMMCGCNMKDKVQLNTSAAFAATTPETIDSLLGTYGADSFKRCWVMRECLKDPSLAKTLRTKLKHTRNNGLQLLEQHEAKNGS